MDWYILATCYYRTIMDDWTEYLCFRRAPGGIGGWEIGICGVDDVGDLVLMTDDAVISIKAISAESIKDAATSLGWARVEDWPDIANICRQHTG